MARSAASVRAKATRAQIGDALATGKVNFKWKRPHLYAKQQDAIFTEKRTAVIEASTKTGKTAGCIVWLVEQGLKSTSGRWHWWVAPTRNVARIAYRRAKRIFPPGTVKENDTDLAIELPNGATLAFKGGDNPDALYGEDVYDVVIDEATRCKDGVWHAIRSTLTATQGNCRIIGNVKGKKNWAYKLARMAEKGAPDMHYARLTIHDAVDAGLIPASEVESARRDLPDNIFKELYLAIPSDDGGNPFGLSNIDRAVDLFRERNGVDTIPDPDGILRDRGWAQPVLSWGWDLAKTMNWTVGIGLDDRGTVTRFLRWHGRPWATTIDDIAAATGTTPGLVDATGVGSPIVEQLQRTSRVEGFIFTETSKQQLMEALAVALSRGEVALPEGPIAQELRDFEYTYTRRGVRYSAPDGVEDDCVMALGMAVESKRRSRGTISGRGLIATL